MHDIDRTQIGREMETYEYPAAESSVFNEQQEMELAAELMEISSEEEFEQFLGSLISRAGKAIGSFASSQTGQALGGLLKQAAGKALPIAGSAIGGYFGGATGAKIGGKLASRAGGLLGLEAETEEAEFEAAVNFVRLAGDAVKNLGSVPRGANPRAAAQAALAKAAEIHAPGLMSQSSGPGGPAGGQNQGGTGGRAMSGRWVRRGSKIVLFGV
jgi:hypothetical protein